MHSQTKLDPGIAYFSRPVYLHLNVPLNRLIFPGFSVFLSFYDYVYLILYGMRLLSMSTVAAPGS